MKPIFSKLFVVAAIAIAAPLTSSAQIYSCPGGEDPIVVPGVGTFCPATVTNVPEVSSSASMAGLALLAGGVLMLSGRKKALSR